ncbi:MAG: hypothetical protein JWM95_1701 [Gemmatimonadetes bacterium]|nr:hypothetical protein [Gemmatimonadota bacterium]
MMLRKAIVTQDSSTFFAELPSSLLVVRLFGRCGRFVVLALILGRLGRLNLIDAFHDAKYGLASEGYQ